MYSLKSNELLLREEISEGYETVANSGWLDPSKIREAENVNKKSGNNQTNNDAVVFYNLSDFYFLNSYTQKMYVNKYWVINCFIFCPLVFKST